MATERPGTYSREEKDRRMPGEGGTPFEKGCPSFPRAPILPSKTFYFGDCGNGPSRQREAQSKKDALAGAALLIPPSVFQKGSLRGGKALSSKYFSESLL